MEENHPLDWKTTNPHHPHKNIVRASINFQNQEVQDFKNETWSQKVTQNLQFTFKTF